MRQVLFVVAVSLVMTKPALAQESFDEFNGAFVYDGEVEEGRARMRRELSAALRDLNPFIRPFVRARLDALAEVSRRIEIRVDERRARVRYVGATTETYDSLLERPMRVRRAEGPELVLTQRLRSGRLEQVFVTDESRVYLLIEPAADGVHIVVTTVVASDRLPRAIRIPLRYRRVSRSSRSRAPSEHTVGPRGSERGGAAGGRGEPEGVRGTRGP